MRRPASARVGSRLRLFFLIGTALGLTSNAGWAPEAAALVRLLSVPVKVDLPVVVAGLVAGGGRLGRLAGAEAKWKAPLSLRQRTQAIRDEP